MTYTAIIGDIINSRGSSDRFFLQKKLQDILDSINDEYCNVIKSNFVITLGDEFQGLLIRPDDAVKIIKKIQAELYPVKIRFGVGIGQITTQINTNAAFGSDGPAYYFAREELEKVKKTEKSRGHVKTDIMISCGEESLMMRSLNNHLSILHLIESGWSQNQRQAISEYEKHEDSHKSISMRLKTAQSTITRRLNSGHYFDYEYTKDTVNQFLEEIGKKEKI